MTDLELATHAALEAGKLLRKHFGSDSVVDEASDHDIKLALDKESQELITTILLGARDGDALYGEEGIAGNQASDRQWIVDPIDGTVNYYYGIPHFCVSIALRVAGAALFEPRIHFQHGHIVRTFVEIFRIGLGLRELGFKSHGNLRSGW